MLTPSNTDEDVVILSNMVSVLTTQLERANHINACARSLIDVLSMRAKNKEPAFKLVNGDEADVRLLQNAIINLECALIGNPVVAIDLKPEDIH